MANDLSNRYNIQNPIIDRDTVTVFNVTYRGKKEEVMVSDTLQRIWSSFKNGNFEVDLQLIHNGFALLEDFNSHNNGWITLGNHLLELFNSVTL